MRRTVIAEPDKFFKLTTMDSREPPTGALVIVGPVPLATLAKMAAFRVGKESTDVIGVMLSLSAVR